jgi:2-oxoglutarate ferredoxin oxidoreductase subunit alpha
MVESIGMAFMMELPMAIVLAQRLGPATGTATCGAQGDLLLLRGINSGGYPIPTLCISSLDDCWSLSAEAVALARRLRTPVVLLTSKEMAMTLQDVDLATLPEIASAAPVPEPGPDYRPYGAGPDDVPPFAPVGHPALQVRLTASTHDDWGDLQHTSAAALDNTRRLWRKVQRHLPSYTFYELDEQPADTIVVACDVTAAAAREAVSRLRAGGMPVSLLVCKTLFPVPPVYLEILSRYRRVVVAEETLTGLYQEVLFGHAGRPGLCGVNGIGRPITPEDIVEGAGR